MRAEAAWAQTVMATPACVAPAEDADVQISSAKVVAASAALDNTRDNVQNHGAIGFTAEHDAGRYLKRAHVCAALLGDRAFHLRRLFAAPPTV